MFTKTRNLCEVQQETVTHYLWELILLQFLLKLPNSIEPVMKMLNWLQIRFCHIRGDSTIKALAHIQYWEYISLITHNVMCIIHEQISHTHYKHCGVHFPWPSILPGNYICSMHEKSSETTSTCGRGVSPLGCPLARMRPLAYSFKSDCSGPIDLKSCQ